MTLGYRIQHRFERLMHLLGEDLSYFAASLSFYTIFSIIPMLWVLFFIISQDAVFAEYYLAIKSFMVANIIPTHTEAVTAYLDSLLENSNKMGFWGVLYTLLVSMLFYNNYQYVVNKIFLIPNKSFWHALETYLILIVLMPVTLVGSFFISDVVQRMASSYGESIAQWQLLSYLMVWLLFFVVIKVSPNMRISAGVAMLTSLMVSLAWQLAKILFVNYVFANETYTTLYGSFSIVLFSLLWIYLSWFLLLHGLRMSYVLECQRHSMR